MKLLKVIAIYTALTLGAFAAPAASAADYPTKPINLVIPFAPGGFVHLVGLLLSEHMGAALGQPVVIINQPGANGLIAATRVARSAPDGYTLLLGTMSIFDVMPHLMKNVSFDTRTDFSSIGMVADTSNIFVVRPESGIKTFKDLVDRAKQGPNKVSYGSTGHGSLQHIAGEILQREVNTAVLHVPYKGTGPALVDLVGNNITFVLGDATALPYVKAGTLSAIAVSPRAMAALPGVPAIADAAAAAGLPGYTVPALWYGVVGPSGIPADIVKKLNKALVETLSNPVVREKLVAGGAVPAENTSSEFLQGTLKTDFVRYGEMLKTINITME